MATGFGNSQNLVDIRDIHDNTVIMEDGSLRQVIMIGGINFSLKSEEEQNMVTGAYQNFLNSVEFPIQIIIHSRKINIQKYLDDLEKRRSEEQSPLLQNQIAEYREFIRQFVEQNAIMEKTFLFVVSWYPSVVASSGGLLSFLPFGKKKDGSAEIAAATEDFRQNAAQLSQRVNQVLEGLTTMGLESAILTTEELQELFYNFYNPGTVERAGVNSPKANA